MMEAHIIAQGKNEPPQFGNLKGLIVDHTQIATMTFCVCEGGMQSGEPSVIMHVYDPDMAENVFIQTSLDKFLMAAQGLVALAKQDWGWERPEGYASIVPDIDPAKRKELLESIKRELESFDG
jgi:hypothetical protein